MAIAERVLTDDHEFQGLSEAEFAQRRVRDAANRPAPQSSRSYRRIVAQTLLSFLNLLIFAISVTLLLLGQFVDAFLTDPARSRTDGG